MEFKSYKVKTDGFGRPFFVSIFLFMIGFGLIPLRMQSMTLGDAGQAGAFLRAGTGARALGMGNAFTALAEDSSASYWNPAGLALVQSPSFGSMVGLLSLNRSFNYLSLAFPAQEHKEKLNLKDTASFPWTGAWGGKGQWGFSWVYFSLGDDFEGRSGDTAAFYTFADQQNAYYLSHGRSIASWLSVGFSGKFLYRELAGFSATGFGLDLSMLALVDRHLRVAVVLADLFTAQGWTTGFKETFPALTRIGLASPWLNGRLVVTGDVQGLSGQQPRYRAGLEGWFFKVLAGRIGVNEYGFTAGGSLVVPVYDTEIRLDYGIAPDPLKIGQTQQFSLFIRF